MIVPMLRSRWWESLLDNLPPAIVLAAMLFTAAFMVWIIVRIVVWLA